MKIAWTYWLIAASLAAGPPASAAERGKQRSAEELINIFLAPGNAQWLVGPIARIASAEEIDAYLEITDDEAAERFVDEFWSRRKPLESAPELSARQQFEHLAEEADLRFSEATYPGRRTDRGTIFILYGPPDRIDHKPVQPARSGRFRSQPIGAGHGVVERWLYETDKVGLDGRSPKRAYHFIRRNDMTRFAQRSDLPKRPR